MSQRGGGAATPHYGDYMNIQEVHQSMAAAAAAAGNRAAPQVPAQRPVSRPAIGPCLHRPSLIGCRSCRPRFDMRLPDHQGAFFFWARPSPSRLGEPISECCRDVITDNDVIVFFFLFCPGQLPAPEPGAQRVGSGPPPHQVWRSSRPFSFLFFVCFVYQTVC